MVKDKRTRETMFSVLMWVVSVVLAAFLIGLGGLIIGDLPRVSSPVTLEQFMDRAALGRIQIDGARLDRIGAEVRQRYDEADRALLDATNDAQAAQTTFDAWVATRTATTDPAQDPELIARTRALEELRNAERLARQTRDDIDAEQFAHQRLYAANTDALSDLEVAASPQYERARFMQDLRVFGLRLAFTLPLLLIACLFLLQKKKGDYWPLQRGFVLFAAFAFFVELVPYLPEYGGYVRYGVGIVLTLLAGHFIVRWMRNYLETRAVSETQARSERKSAIEYEDALKKLTAKACPGCDRAMATTDDAPADYCVHCGMHWFNRCTQCEARKFAFFRYCMKCGAPAKEAQVSA